jgi:hypothetical protein
MTALMAVQFHRQRGQAARARRKHFISGASIFDMTRCGGSRRGTEPARYRGGINSEDVTWGSDKDLLLLAFFHRVVASVLSGDRHEIHY